MLSACVICSIFRKEGLHRTGKNGEHSSGRKVSEHRKERCSIWAFQTRPEKSRFLSNGCLQYNRQKGAERRIIETKAPPPPLPDAYPHDGLQSDHNESSPDSAIGITKLLRKHESSPSGENPSRPLARFERHQAATGIAPPWVSILQAAW